MVKLVMYTSKIRFRDPPEFGEGLGLGAGIGVALLEPPPQPDTVMVIRHAKSPLIQCLTLTLRYDNGYTRYWVKPAVNTRIQIGNTAIQIRVSHNPPMNVHASLWIVCVVRECSPLNLNRYSGTPRA